MRHPHNFVARGWLYVDSMLIIMVDTCTHDVHYYIPGLLDDMIAAISSKSLPHYFLPHVNLLENIPDDFNWWSLDIILLAAFPS